MREKCHKCGDDQDLVEGAPRVLRHALPRLKSPVEVEVTFTCANCGSEVRRNIQLVPTDQRSVQAGTTQGQPAAEQRMGRISQFAGEASMFLQYPAVLRAGENVLFPAHEGSLSGGHAIDRHGDPDLMAEFSAEYLKQYWAILPKGRLPRTVSEMMPALHLLMNAAELAMKADLVRSGDTRGGHTLQTLYRCLDCEHRREIERRFADAGPNANLKALGFEGPTAESVLKLYGSGFGWSPVYEDTRYFAEPTTKMKSDSVKGGNLVKQTVYPIFLPVLVQTMIDAYAFFSGAERLKRLGAEGGYRSRDPGNDNHGDWGLVPSSVGLVVLRVAQFVATDKQGVTRPVFDRFKAARPPGYCTSWMYGGNWLLFYRVGEEHPEDGEAVIDGLECRIWYTGRLGMHARDLYLLADALEAPGDLDVFQWANAPKS